MVDGRLFREGAFTGFPDILLFSSLRPSIIEHPTSHKKAAPKIRNGSTLAY
jgi:hypothetical protein